MSQFSNAEVADLLRGVAAAYQIKNVGNIFQIRAYESAADSIEHSTQEVLDLWQQGKLAEIPGVGKSIHSYLDELFRTGKVRHFREVMKDIPASTVQFLKIPGIGPKTAFKLSTEGRADSVQDLKQKIISGDLLKAGFSAKAIANLSRGISQMERLSHRLLLPEAIRTAEEVISALKEDPSVLEAYPLGSIRRMAATVGDIDLGVSTKDPKRVIEVFTTLPQVGSVSDKGEVKATVILKNGLQVDLLTAHPSHFGSALQHFTGSKAHNVHLRTLAQDKGWSISEHGLKNIKTGRIVEAKTEEEVYKKIGLPTPPPEIREDTGEIEAALAGTLPQLLTQADIKGDLHSHTYYSDGHDSVTEMGLSALSLGYQYLALTDHSYPNLKFEERIKEIEDFNYSNRDVRVIKGLEVNVTTESKLQVSDQVLARHEFNTASIHSGFNQDSQTLTERVLTALKHPLISMISHPTGRLLGEREGYDLDWEKVFNAASLFDKILEINGFPNRSDLPDQLIREAARRGIKMAVNTDSHHGSHLELMKFGVALARRGWAKPALIVNTWSRDKLLTYLAKPRINL